ncbi:MAG: hypothetical protein IPO40_02590 [Fibrobacteres bacterium]|nr:hypothetical protein [Fibrobacterota bacterium]
MKLPRPFLALTIALVPALTQAAPTVLPVTWEQRAPSGFDITAASFKGTIFALGVAGGGSDGIFWASTDTGRTWKTQTNVVGTVNGLKSFQIDGEEVLFLLNTPSASSATRLIRRDKDGEAVVLDSLVPYLWSSPILQAGNVLLLRTKKALMRSGDGGKTWKAVEPAFLTIQYGESEPAVLAGSEKRMLAMVSQQRSLFSSLDSGKSWKRLSDNFSVPSMRDGGVVDRSGETFFLPNSNGAPIRLRFQGETWRQDTLRTGWPLDSMGIGAMTRSIVSHHDTIWATAGKNLLYWQEAESSWRSAKIDLPDFGDQVVLDVIAGDLWLFGAEWVVRRGIGGKVQVEPPSDSKFSSPKTALAWQHDSLFLCGWTGCAISKDSGRSWKPANRGLEGTYIVGLKSTSQGLMATTGYFGLRLWNGTYWQDAGMSGIDRDSTTGRYSMISSLTSLDDTLAFSWAWGDGIWMRKGKQAGWSLIEHGSDGQIAWANGTYWTLKSGDTLETSKSGSAWTNLKAPFNGTVHGVDGQLVVARSYGNQIARWQGNAFRVDTMDGSFGSYGSFVTAHPSGVMALTTKGAYLATNSGVYELPFEHASISYWISGLLLVGNRLFVTHDAGMLSTTLPAQIQVALQPRDRRSWGIHNLSRGVALDLAKPAHVEFSWYDLSGARRGGIDQVMEAGEHALVVPANIRGAKIVRVSVDGVLSESRVLVMP